VSDAEADELEAIRPLLESPQAVAVGETGLDFFRDRAPRDAQLRLFERHLELAHELEKPVVVHTHKRGKPRVAPPAASKARMAKKQTITARSGIKAAKQTLFQTFKLSDGTPIGEVSYSELPAIARRSDLDAMVCRAIYYHVTPTDQSAKVKELVSEDFLQHAIQSAKGERDALVAVVAA